MTTLILIRHAKAGEGWEDHERPLAGRGASDAAAVGRWLTDRGLVAHRVVVSTARRTRETWAAIATAVDWPAAPEYDARIYDNSVSGLLEVLRETPADVDTVALVGHNPATHALALTIDDGSGDLGVRTRVQGKFPTSAVAVLEIEVAWDRLGEDTGHLVGYTDPSD